MSIKRRKDSKNRVLKEGESERKNGTYEYKYRDFTGKRKSVYGKTLEELREKEKEIEKNLTDGIVSNDLTVFQLVNEYLSQKNNVKEKTMQDYRSALKVLEKEPFAKVKIDMVSVMSAKRFLSDLQNKNGMSYSYANRMKEILKPAFQTAFENDFIRKNPFDFRLSDVVRNDTKKREALTEEQMNSFLEFIRTNEEFSVYYNGIYVLFHTGLRISELCGLTKRDVNIRERTITVDHQLTWISGRLHIETTKTEAGKRTIPVSESVMQCIKGELKSRKSNDVIIDGYAGFIFLSKTGNPTTRQIWQARFKKILKEYNKSHMIQMPNVTPHICRHTFCSNMAKQGMNPKVLQYIMGHSNIGVTLNIYTHTGLEDARKEMDKLSEKTG